MIQRAGFLGALLRYADNQLSWPDVLRWKGSVLLPTFIPVLGMSLFSFAIYVCYEKLNLAVSIPLSVCKFADKGLENYFTHPFCFYLGDSGLC
jgi:hypothetical protein